MSEENLVFFARATIYEEYANSLMAKGSRAGKLVFRKMSFYTLSRCLLRAGSRIVCFFHVWFVESFKIIFLMK